MVSDDLSVVIGIWSDVTGVDSVVIGNDSVVIDIASVVIGIDSVVIGIDSVVIGIDFVVENDSVVIGTDSVVIGTDSVVIGIINSVVWNSFVFHAVVTGGVFFVGGVGWFPHSGIWVVTISAAGAFGLYFTQICLFCNLIWVHLYSPYLHAVEQIDGSSSHDFPSGQRSPSCLEN